MTKISIFFYSILEKKKSLSNDKLKKYALILSLSLFIGIIHVLFALIYFISGVWILACCHLVGMAGVFLCNQLLREDKYNFAGLLMTLTFATVLTLDDFFVGVNNYSVLYLLLLLIMTMIIPYSNKRVPIVLGIALPLLMAGTFIFEFYHTPYYDLGGLMANLAVFNILLASTLSIIVMKINRFIDTYIDVFVEMQLSDLQKQA
ncbi:hypothetical protein LJC56_10835, partial [Christensenellaceae bacterium OttesenSCG-928-K19]|nr:hypothetical protein [Christensenellaceae bacterium OttesenSCG-928-K19]